MFDFLCCKIPGLIRSFCIRLIVVIGIVALVLWIVAMYTSEPDTVNVPPISAQAAENAKLYFQTNDSSSSSSSTNDDCQSTITVNSSNSTVSNGCTGGTDPTNNHHSIVIVGAGAAGLFAGYTLKYLGIDDFIILEAHPELYGGRVREYRPSSSDTGGSHSNDDATTTAIDVDVPIDLGAEWIHANPKVLQDLLLFEDDRQLASSFIAEETIIYQPQSYDAFTNRRVARNIVRFFYSEYKFYNKTWFSYLDRFVYPYISSHLQLDTAIRSIDYSDPSNVIIQTASSSNNTLDTFSADKVILAVPITALQQQYTNHIEFVPSLPSWKQTAINKVSMADGMKVWLEFDERFYADMIIASSLISYVSDDPILFFDSVFRKPSTKHILTQFIVGGPNADRTKLSNKEIVQAALADLDKIYDGKATHYYTGKFIVQNWSKELFIQGAYPLNFDDYWDDLPTLRQSVDNRLYFAGSYMNDEITTVHGAALSGRRVVDDLLVEVI